MIQGNIYGISLGPGDADLITLKGLRTLQQVDKIYYPGSVFKDGSTSSYSRTILNHYDLNPEKLEGFYLKMDTERTQAKAMYETTFQHLLKDYQKGLAIAIVSEGDISTYSSFSYLLEKIKAHKLPLTLIPGITSYVHLAAAIKTPLCLQNETVTIVPRVQSTAHLQEAILHYDTVILMKIKSVFAILTDVIDSKEHSIAYAERLGTDQQFVTTNWAIAKQRAIPYFALLIIKKNKP